MTTACPTCGRRYSKRKPAPVKVATFKITKADRPTAFSAWLRYFYSTGQTYAAWYWEKRGYVDAPTEFPPAAEHKAG